MGAEPWFAALWHFTCADHGYANLGERGFLLPRLHPLMPELGAVVWLTSDPSPDRDDVGLTSMITPCDRLAYRYRVDSVSQCLPWVAIRSKVNREWRDNAERFGKPETWFISQRKIAATLDQPAAGADSRSALLVAPDGRAFSEAANSQAQPDD